MSIKKFLFSTVASFTILSMLLAPMQQAHAIDFDDIFNVLTSGTEVKEGIVAEVLEPIVEDFANRALNKVIDSTLNWAFDEGFEGSPGFINNYEDLIDSVESGEILKHVTQAISTADESLTEYLGSEEYEQDFIQDQIDEYLTGQNAGNSGGYVYDDIGGDCDGDGMLNGSETSQTDPVLFGGSIQNCQDYNPPPPPTPGDDDEDQEYDDMGGDCDCDGTLNLADPNFENLSESAYAQTCYDYSTSCSSIQGIVSGGQAQANYEGFQSRLVRETRNTAQTLARIGAEQLNAARVKALIDGEGFTLETIVGDNYRQFGNDIEQGGWLAYIAQGDPHNNPTGKELLIKNALVKQVEEKVTAKKDEINLPSLFLNKTDCVERDDDNNCVKEKVTTPGNVVAEKVFKGTTKDETQAEQADGLILRLLKNAVGRLTDGILNKGLSKITGSINNSFEVGSFANLSAGDSSINVDYTNGFGIVTAETPGTGIYNEITGTTSGTTPINFDFASSGENVWVGGPEHLGPGWDEKPDILVNFQEELGINKDMAEVEEKLLSEVRGSLKGAVNTVERLDHCVPGPDLRWEKRWDDLIQPEDSTDRNYAAIGKAETTEMADDRRMNIPGAFELKSSISRIFEDSQSARAAVKQRLESIRKVFDESLAISNQVERQFSDFTEGIPEFQHLELFQKSWHNWTETPFADLSTERQEDLHELLTVLATYSPSDAIAPYFVFEPLGIDLTDPPQPGDVVERDSWTPDLDNPYEVGLAVDWFLENRPQDVFKAQHNMAWDIWRGVLPSNLGSIPNDGLDEAEEFAAHEKKKSQLRFNFEVLRTDFSNRQLIERARIERDRITNALLAAESHLHDCRVFKAFALAAPSSWYYESDGITPRNLANDGDDYGVWSNGPQWNDMSHIGLDSGPMTVGIPILAAEYPKAPVSYYSIARQYTPSRTLPQADQSFVDNGIGFGISGSDTNLLLTSRTVTIPRRGPDLSNGGRASYWWGTYDGDDRRYKRSWAFAYSSLEFMEREVPSDSEVLDFIQEEFVKQETGEQSLFKTQAITAPENIELSIFGYPSFGFPDAQFPWPNQYIADRYVSIGSGQPLQHAIGGWNSNVLWSAEGAGQGESNILKRMYFYDDMGVRWKKENGDAGSGHFRSGTLYCRSNLTLPFLGPERWTSHVFPTCLWGHHRSQKLDYHLLINGI